MPPRLFRLHLEAARWQGIDSNMAVMVPEKSSKLTNLVSLEENALEPTPAIRSPRVKVLGILIVYSVS